MAAPTPPPGEQEFREEEASLVRITFGPVVWIAHFVASYAATAVYCAKLVPILGGMGPLRWGIAAATAAALAAIAWAGWHSWRQWRKGNEDTFDDPDDSSEDRHQFLGHAALLLAVISFIGVVYTALPALLSASCL